MHQANSDRDQQQQQQQTWDSLIDRGCFFFGASALFSRRLCAADVCTLTGCGGAREMEIVLRDARTRDARCVRVWKGVFEGTEAKARRTQDFDWRRDSTLVRYASLWWHARARASVDMDNGMYALTPCCWCGVMVVWWSVLLGMSLGYCGSRALER